MDMPAAAVPALPTEAVRRALDAGEWDLAAELLRDHERAVREAIARNAPDAGTREAWLALLSAQRSFLSQLQSARSDTARELQQLSRDRRGVRAYRAGGG
jgi:hypothetical protein